VTRFLIPRFPPTMSEQDKRQTATELTDWGRRLVDKTHNLGKQKTARPPEVPPIFADGVPIGPHVGGIPPTRAPETPDRKTPQDTQSLPAKDDIQPWSTDHGELNVNLPDEPPTGQKQTAKTTEKPATQKQTTPPEAPKTQPPVGQQTPKTAEKEKPDWQKKAEYDELIRQAREKRKREKLNQRDYDALKREFEREQASLRDRREVAAKALKDFQKDLEWRKKHQPQDKDGIERDRARIRSIEKEMADLFERDRDLWKTPPYDRLQKGVRPYESDEIPDDKPKPDASAQAPKSSSGHPSTSKTEAEKPGPSPPAGQPKSGAPVGGPVEP